MAKDFHDYTIPCLERTTLLDLPNEVLLNIMQSLNARDDLSSLMFVSKQMRMFVEDLAYRNICVPDYNMKPGNSDKISSLYNTLIARPDLARHVRSFSVQRILDSDADWSEILRIVDIAVDAEIQSIHSTIEIIDDVHRSCAGLSAILVDLIIPQMTNLEILSIKRCGRPDTPTYYSLFCNASDHFLSGLKDRLPKLSKLIVVCHGKFHRVFDRKGNQDTYGGIDILLRYVPTIVELCIVSDKDARWDGVLKPYTFREREFGNIAKIDIQASILNYDSFERLTRSFPAITDFLCEFGCGRNYESCNNLPLTEPMTVREISNALQAWDWQLRRLELSYYRPELNYSTRREIINQAEKIFLRSGKFRNVERFVFIIGNITLFHDGQNLDLDEFPLLRGLDTMTQREAQSDLQRSEKETVWYSPSSAIYKPRYGDSRWRHHHPRAIVRLPP